MFPMTTAQKTTSAPARGRRRSSRQGRNGQSMAKTGIVFCQVITVGGPTRRCNGSVDGGKTEEKDREQEGGVDEGEQRQPVRGDNLVAEAAACTAPPAAPRWLSGAAGCMWPAAVWKKPCRMWRLQAKQRATPEAVTGCAGSPWNNTERLWVTIR